MCTSTRALADDNSGLVRSIVASHDWLYRRSSGATIDRTLGHRISRVLTYDRTQYATIARTIGRRMQRSIDRTIGRRPSRLIVRQSLIATTSCKISCDGSCHRYSPIVSNRSRVRPLLEIVAKLADRSHFGPIAINRTIQKSYDPV